MATISDKILVNDNHSVLLPIRTSEKGFRCRGPFSETVTKTRVLEKRGHPLFEIWHAGTTPDSLKTSSRRSVECCSRNESLFPSKWEKASPHQEFSEESLQGVAPKILHFRISPSRLWDLPRWTHSSFLSGTIPATVRFENPDVARKPIFKFQAIP